MMIVFIQIIPMLNIVIVNNYGIQGESQNIDDSCNRGKDKENLWGWPLLTKSNKLIVYFLFGLILLISHLCTWEECMNLTLSVLTFVNFIVIYWWPQNFIYTHTHTHTHTHNSESKVGALTCCTLLHSVCDSKAVQMNVQRCLIQKLMSCEFEICHNVEEATKNIYVRKVKVA